MSIQHGRNLPCTNQDPVVCILLSCTNNLLWSEISLSSRVQWESEHTHYVPCTQIDMYLCTRIEGADAGVYIKHKTARNLLLPEWKKVQRNNWCVFIAYHNTKPFMISLQCIWVSGCSPCDTQKEQSKQSLIESVASISIDIIIYPSVLQTLKIVFVHFPFSIIMFLIEFTRPTCYARMF